MNKAVSKSVIFFTLILSLVSSISVAQADITVITGLHLAYAPYIAFPSNATYNSRVLTLDVSFRAMIMGNANYSMTYSLDGNSNKSIDLKVHYFGFFFMDNKSYIDGSVVLPELTETSHNITIYLTCNYWYWSHPNYPNADYYTYSDSQTVHFTIDTTAPALTPTPIPTPSATPLAALSPSPAMVPTSTPISINTPSPSPSSETLPTPSISPTPISLSSPNESPRLFASPSPSNSQQPASLPNPQSTIFQTELIYATAAIAIIVVITITAVVLKRRKKQ